jgi:hypothetical protein
MRLSLAKLYDRAIPAAFAFAKPLEQLDLSALDDGLATVHLRSRRKLHNAFPERHDARTRRYAGTSHGRYLLSVWLGLRSRGDRRAVGRAGQAAAPPPGVLGDGASSLARRDAVHGRMRMQTATRLSVHPLIRRSTHRRAVLRARHVTFALTANAVVQATRPPFGPGSRRCPTWRGLEPGPTV